MLCKFNDLELGFQSYSSTQIFCFIVKIMSSDENTVSSILYMGFVGQCYGLLLRFLKYPQDSIPEYNKENFLASCVELKSHW